MAWGILIAFYIVYSSTRPIPPLWQTIGFGAALGLFITPFLFMTITRTSRFMSPWEALALLAAAVLCPLAMRLLGERGVHPIQYSWRMLRIHRLGLPCRKGCRETAPLR